MQGLALPTRDEIDNTHRRNICLDIGVPSVRNISKISRNRVILWGGAISFERPATFTV